MFFQWTDYRTTIIDSQFTWENIPCEQKKIICGVSCFTLYSEQTTILKNANHRQTVTCHYLIFKNFSFMFSKLHI